MSIPKTSVRPDSFALDDDEEEEDSQPLSKFVYGRMSHNDASSNESNRSPVNRLEKPLRNEWHLHTTSEEEEEGDDDDDVPLHQLQPTSTHLMVSKKDESVFKGKKIELNDDSSIGDISDLDQDNDVMGREVRR
jgi:hypothetical protein